MPDENNSGAAYLAALKRSTPQAAGAAPARASDSTSPSGNRTGGVEPDGKAGSTGVEKRRSPRYRCQGSAHLREISSGVSTWATFTDISLHGCYVEAMSTYRVGARLALTIEVNSFRVECRGEVRAAYPNLGMGIGFTAMLDQDREQLRELLRSLSRPSVVMDRRVANSSPSPQPEAASVTDPHAALQAIVKFFDERHMLSRDEFLRILRKHQGSGG